MLITSLENNKVKEIVKLKDKKYRDETNLFVIETDKLIEEAHKKDLLLEVFKLEDYNLNIDIPFNDITPQVMKKISSLENSKILGICKKEAGTLLGTKYLLLDEIQDPGNLGTILRIALAFNIDTVILSNDTCDLYNFKAVMASCGSLFHLNIVRDDLNIVIKNLKSKNIKVFGTDVEKGTNLKDIRISDNYAIIMGNEGKGMKEELKALCDDFIYIKTNKMSESINVSSAASIILYELNR